jgi:predicted lipid-binding transport protein (Tim44 family)
MGTLQSGGAYKRMNKTIMLLLLIPLLMPGIAPAATLEQSYETQEQSDVNADTVRPYKRGGSYRSPRQGYNPGIGTPARTPPVAPNPTVRKPSPPKATPGTRTGFGGFFGGLFGGLALGTILGSLFNPFSGFSLGVPFLSIVSMLLWLLVIVFVVRLFRRKNNNYR